MSKFYDECIRYFDNHNIKYIPDEKLTLITVLIGSEERTHIIHIDFNDDGDKYVHFVWQSDNKIKSSSLIERAIFAATNLMNKKYRWVKFYYDNDDNYVYAEDDAIVDLYTVGEECWELAQRMVRIVDDFCDICDKAKKDGIEFFE